MLWNVHVPWVRRDGQAVILQVYKCIGPIAGSQALLETAWFALLWVTWIFCEAMTDVEDLGSCSMLRKIDVGEALELLQSEGWLGFRVRRARSRSMIKASCIEFCGLCAGIKALNVECFEPARMGLRQGCRCSVKWTHQVYNTSTCTNLTVSGHINNLRFCLQGWVTITGNQGKTYLKPASRQQEMSIFLVLLTCAKSGGEALRLPSSQPCTCRAWWRMWSSACVDAWRSIYGFWGCEGDMTLEQFPRV